MVKIRAFIQRKKEAFRQQQVNKSQTENIKRADELQRLRTERIRMEGKANLEQAKQQELAKISAAKAKAPSNLMKFGQGLAGVINRAGKSKGTKSKGSMFGGNTVGGTGSKGIDFGGRANGSQFGGQKGLDFGGKSSSPFNSIGRVNQPAKNRKSSRGA